MKSAKLNIAFAAFGFLLSLIVGIVTRVTFGVLILRAVVFAVAFAAISVGIQILIKRIFSASADDMDAIGGGAAESKTVGAVVDITLPDEDLPEDPGAPQFFVGESHQMLNESDYGQPAPKPDAAAPEPVAAADGQARTAAAAKAAPEQKTDDAAQKTEAAPAAAPEQPAEPAAATDGQARTDAAAKAAPEQKANDAAQKTEAAPAAAGFSPAPLSNVAKSSAGPQGKSQASGLDDLPVLSDLRVEEEAAGGGADVYEADAPRGQNDGRPRSVSNGKPVVIENADTALMARAISTVLSGDDS